LSKWIVARHDAFGAGDKLSEAQLVSKNGISMQSNDKLNILLARFDDELVSQSDFLFDAYCLGGGITHQEF